MREYQVLACSLLMLLYSSVALLQLEKIQGQCAAAPALAPAVDSSSSTEIIRKISDAHSSSVSAAPESKQRYPQPSLESLLSAPSPSTAPSNHRSSVPPAVHANLASEADAEQLRLHVVALEQQISILRDAVQDAQEQRSLFEKQCDWFKKKELELQLSQERNRGGSASDLDYLRRHATFGFVWLRFYTPMTDIACVQRGCVLHGVARPCCNTCNRPGAVQPLFVLLFLGFLSFVLTH